ncbi:putative porin [Ulvibacter antarcticus]|uniref:Putative beta-barrel porin n=1 Tax=Ulvibacter antarcticus TaxID=442714 RepID=A0A3L9Y9W7_9FLAO|nr:putative porin [Ulvibacter antarcticus]RMA57164.1 putative beta-barrel porin [Ulvibacter antarcticus]
MKNTFLLLFLLSVSATVFSQESRTPNPSEKQKKPPIELYRIISAQRDTTYIDTTLSIQKEYKFNYLRKDDFELLAFSNVGQTYNSLAYNFDRLNLKPLFAAQSHHFNYYEIGDINYYHVPTPLTEIYFKTAFRQGQQLDAFFTVNTSEQFNFSVAYKGIRSLGNYQHILTSTGNFTFTSNYHTKNKRYNIRAHIAAQDVLNRENGGLTDNSLQLFIDDDPEFTDRGRLDVNFEDGENKLEGLRFYGDHSYELISKKDSTNYSVLTIGNTISYEDKFYEYRQVSPYAGFGPSYELANLKETVKLEDFNAKVYAHFNNSIIGKLTAFAGYTDFNYGYNSVLILNNGRITNRLKENIIEAGAAYEKDYKGFQLSGKAALNVSGDYDGNYLRGAASFALDKDNKAEASLTIHSVAPNFNFQLYQSDYVNYNWQNDLNNVKTQELRFDLISKKLLNASVSYTGIDDYTYFGIKENDSTPTPMQFNERVDYLKVKAEKEIKYKKFGLANTVLFQQVLSGDAVFNVPQIVTRQSLYYEDHLFKKALFLQTGVNFKYFSKYNMNAYDPVLAEFYVQNDQELGGFPMLDFFFNAKVKQTRIFFKWEHFNTLFKSTNDHFSAPGYPYRGAVIRFGLVWDFFL